MTGHLYRRRFRVPGTHPITACFQEVPPHEGDLLCHVLGSAVSVAHEPILIKTRLSGNRTVFRPITAHDAETGGTAAEKCAPTSRLMVAKVAAEQVPHSPHRTVPTDKHTVFPLATVRDVRTSGKPLYGSVKDASKTSMKVIQ